MDEDEDIIKDASTGHHSSTQHHASPHYVWYVIFLLTTVNVLNYVDRMALAVMAPSIKADLSLSDSELGLLTGLAFAIFYAVWAIPIARWADRGIRRNIIALAITTWSAMTALSGAAQNFWHMLVARTGVAAGEAGSWSPGGSILCDYVPVKQRSGALAVFGFGNYAGVLVGMMLAGWLADMIGWRWAFVALGAPGVVLALIVRFSLREPPRGFFDATKDDNSSLPLGQTLAVLWHCRTYRLLTLFMVVNGFVQYGFNQWWPSFYVRSFDLSLSAVGINLGLAYGGGAGIGIILGGLVANRVAQRDLRLPLVIGAMVTVLAVPSALGSLFVPSVASSIFLVFLTGVFWGVSNGPVLAGAFSVVAPEMRATSGAVSIFLISVLGFGLGPFCVGVLSDILTPSRGAEALRYALVAPACLIPVMVILLLGAARTLPGDLQSAGAQVEDDVMPEAPIKKVVAEC